MLQAGVSDHLYNRQVIKQDERWSIYGALAGTQKFKGGFKFLESNSKASLFEFRTAYSSGMGEVEKPLKSVERFTSEVDVSVGISILSVQYEKIQIKKNEHMSAHLNLRLIGSSDQDTSLSIFYGNSETAITDVKKILNINSGLQLTLYLQNQVGLKFRNSFLETSDNQKNWTGDHTSVEVFWELGAFRIFMREQKLNLKNKMTSEKIKLNSPTLGLALYF